MWQQERSKEDGRKDNDEEEGKEEAKCRVGVGQCHYGQTFSIQPWRRCTSKHSGGFSEPIVKGVTFPHPYFFVGSAEHSALGQDAHMGMTFMLTQCEMFRLGFVATPEATLNF